MSDRNTTPSALLGRARQREQLAAVLRDERNTAFLRAAAGSGKTALLDELADTARETGWTVHRVTGTPAEQSFPFATLTHLVLPLRPHLPNLAPRAREALETALGMSVAEPAGVMALGIALTDLLTDVATAAPVLVIVDDEHWIDAASAAVLSFAARRLTGLPVAIAAAARDGHPRMLDVAGFDVIGVPALDADAADDLLHRTCPDLAGPTVASVLARAAGNPLAIIELGKFAEQQDGASGGELPDRVEHMFADRVAELPPAEAAELLRMALDVRAGPASSYRPTTVELATRSRLVVADPVTGGVRFTHPLVADVVAARATANELRQAHRELAELPSADIERAAHHRAAAAVDPDESIARDLENAAHRAVRRGGSAAAVDWLVRAAELSPAPEDRQRRLRDAAYVASQSGLLDKAEALADRSSSYDPSPASATTVLTDAFVKFYRAGALVPAHRVVFNALTYHVADLDDVSVGRFANILLAVATYAADAAIWDRTELTLTALTPRLPDVTALLRAAWKDPSARGRALRDEVHDRLASARAENPWDVMRLLIAAYYLDLLPEHRHLLDRVVEREAAAGVVANEVTGLNLLVKADTAAGAWDDALEASERGLKTARRHGFALFEHHFLIYRAEMLAHRGEFDEALRLQSIVERWARPRGVGLLTQHVDTVGVAVGLAAGDHESAWQFANGLSPTGSISPYAHQARRGLFDHVETAVATGRTDAARAHAAAGRRAGLHDFSPRLDMLMLAAEALTADAEAAGALFDGAVTHPAGGAFVFDAARIALHHGSWLLDQRRPDEAATALRRALATFEHLGAAPWAARARDDLQRAAQPRADTLRWQSLTAQELTIAELAASGMSNKQIGAQLFLSPRTVSTHLYRIFPKLGIGSRAALRDALTAARPMGRQAYDAT